MCETFNSSLSNFIKDSAVGGAVRHLADLELSPKEILNRLDYPVPLSTITEIMWKHYIDSGTICIDKPDENTTIEKISYVEESGAYGRRYMRRVVDVVNLPSKEYVICDFGRLLHKDSEAFMHNIDSLDEKDKDYLLNMPWPLTPVYHAVNKRISRIQQNSRILSQHE